MVRTVLGANVGIHDPLMAAGLDSLGATELRNALQRVTGVALPATLVFDHPTVAALTTHIVTLLASLGSASGGRAEVVIREEASPFLRSLTTGQAKAEPLAVMASDMRLPCGAVMTLRAVDASAVVPLQRWDVEAQRGIGVDVIRCERASSYEFCEVGITMFF